MSADYPEQHPLLCEASEEELYKPLFYSKKRPMNYRVRNNLKGATAILAHWPDHWSSLLTYWWIGIGMISLTTFIIYNCMFAFSIIPSADMKLASSIIKKENNKTSDKSIILPEVFMHVFVDQDDDTKMYINQYMPYIERLSKTFNEFKLNFIVVVNDTYTNLMSAEENNELALNMLLTKDKKPLMEYFSPDHNIIVKYTTISAYMENSPLKKYWRVLPNQLLQFLARTVSVWDKGGVAFNPVILTPLYQHTAYEQKLQDLLNKYAHTNKCLSDTKLKYNFDNTPKSRKQLNNIQEIIYNLEHDDIDSNDLSLPALSEAEDIQVIRHANLVNKTSNNNDTTTTLEAETINEIKPNINSVTQSSTKISEKVTDSEPIYYSKDENTKFGLIPLFLDLFAHNKVGVRYNSIEKREINKTEKETLNTFIPLREPSTDVYDRLKLESLYKSTKNTKSENLLTIDVKGNIIATKTACHAFLGTIFSNAIHHSNEETTTDFIIAELTIFCKGILSSCMGIDLILL